MDHDHEIAIVAAGKKETALFLKEDALSRIRDSVSDMYDLKTEYAKTAKNRSWFVILLIGGTVIITAFLSWIVSGAINNQMREISVNIESFEDLNLKNILDLASRVETNYQNALYERMAIEGRWDVEISALETAAESERYKIRSLSLSPQETLKRLSVIDRGLKHDIQQVNERYTGQIQELDVKIAEYSKQLASFDSDRIEQAQEMQRIADAEALRFQHEKEELIARYEGQLAIYRDMFTEAQQEGLKTQSGSLDEVVARYMAEIASLDPTLRDEEAALILEQSLPPFATQPMSHETPEMFAPENGQQPLFARMNEDYGKMEYLTQQVLTIPWKNNTPDYIRGMSYLFFTSMHDIGTEVSLLADRMEKQKAAFEAQIASLSHQVDSLIVENQTLTDGLQALTEQKGALESDLYALHEQKGALEARIASLSHQVDSFIAENQALTDDLQALTEQKGALESDLYALHEQKGALEAQIASLSQQLEASNDLLARNRAYFGVLAEKNGVVGYIIDSNHAENILVYIDPLYGFSFKDRPAHVFRTGNEYIGTIRISGDNNVFIASAVELSPGKTIEVGDRILLNAGGGF
jgi:hypothetical protein